MQQVYPILNLTSFRNLSRLLSKFNFFTKIFKKIEKLLFYLKNIRLIQ